MVLATFLVYLGLRLLTDMERIGSTSSSYIWKKIEILQFLPCKSGVDVISPEGTYLLWLDLRKLGLSQDELMKFLIEKAKLGLNDGLNFGPDGAGFVRMNIGCPRKILREGINRLVRALS